jgi:hypothetical protein
MDVSQYFDENCLSRKVKSIADLGSSATIDMGWAGDLGNILNNEGGKKKYEDATKMNKSISGWYQSE